MQYVSRYVSPLGELLLACSEAGLLGVWFTGQAHFAAGLSAGAVEAPHPVLTQTARWLDVYFGGGVPDFTPPLAPEGTPFQREVWGLLLQVPYGHTVTYGELAARLAAARGSRCSARAVGGAVGRNPISLIVPCHRVIGADGSLTGYAGGTERKRFLLAAERASRP